MKKTLLTLIALALLLVAVLLFNALRFTAPPADEVAQVTVPVDAGRVSNHLSEAIRYPTIATGNAATQKYEAYRAFADWAQQTYPEVYAAMNLQMIAEHTILLEWPGTDTALQPILLTAHYDVVPVVPGSESEWDYPPFSGEIAQGYVWGRGALDDKSGMIAMYEAATLLLQQSFVPRRTIYLSFGHDEETGGELGAAGVTSFLQQRDVQLAWSLDEGSFVTEGVIPGVANPVASVNVAEKGYLTLELIARGPGGHSSMPEAELATDILARALVNLRKHPLPGGVEGVTAESFDILGRHMPFGLKLLFANRWLFGPLLEKQLGKEPRLDALMRTTTAPTILQAGIKPNVIPSTATAVVNFRLHPRDTATAVQQHVIAAIDDPRVEVQLAGDGLSSPASGISSRDGEGYEAISTALRQVFPGVIVVPGMTVGGTDSKHYGKVADDAYRINLMNITAQEIAGFHGKNERISVQNLVAGTAAYYLLLKASAGARD